MDCIREALKFDLYYRENCKSRPEWVGSLEPLKPYTRFYCKNGKMSHLEVFSYDFLGGDYMYRDEPVWVLFSYDRRDPLTNQAHVEYVDPCEDIPLIVTSEKVEIEWQPKEH